MPTAVETRVQAYAHCINPMCPGYGQEEVPAIATETSYTFRDHGGDSREVFRSFIELRFVVDAPESDHEAYGEQYREAAACGSCGRPRELAATQRPSYQPLSGHDPMGLLNAMPFNPAMKNTQADADRAEEMATMRREMAELKAMLKDKSG
jgi:hypothetical protein